MTSLKRCGIKIDPKEVRQQVAQLPVIQSQVVTGDIVSVDCPDEQEDVPSDIEDSEQDD